METQTIPIAFDPNTQSARLIPNGMPFLHVDLMIRDFKRTCKERGIQIAVQPEEKYMKDKGALVTFKTIDDFIMARFVF